MTGSYLLPSRDSKPLHSVLFLFFLLSSLLFVPGTLQAHFRTISYSKWVVSDSNWNVQVRLPVLELERLFGRGTWDEETVRAYIHDRFGIKTESGHCTTKWLGGSVKLTDFVVNWTLDCEEPAQSLYINAFFDTAPSHLHYARIHMGNKVLEQIVTAATTSVSLVREERNEFFTNSFNSGLRHLIAGLDHVFFIAGLVLLANSLISLLKIVTAFTIAHAVSLSVLALGLVKAAPRSVEALIGLSILVIATELFIRWSPARQACRWRVVLSSALAATVIPAALGWIPISPLALLGFALINFSFIGLGTQDYSKAIPWIHASGFGLIHGMGIAGALGTINRGSEDGSILSMVLGFNLGVEVGQIVIAVLLFALFTWILRMVEWLPITKWAPQELAASALMAVGTYMFVGRALGLT